MSSDTIVQFDFSEALTHLRAGKRVRRAMWGDCWLELDSSGAEPQLISHRHDWAPRPAPVISSYNILATDWVPVEEDVRTEAVDAGK